MVGSEARRVPERAPEPLALVQDFVNTLHVEKGTAALSDPGSRRPWLTGLVGRGPVPDPSDLAVLRKARAALRDLVSEHEVVRAATSLNRLAAHVALRPGIARDGTIAFEAAPDVPLAGRVLAQLLAAMQVAQREGTRSRLKICRNDASAWAFYDISRNHS